MSKRIMIVDDAEYMREMLEEIIDTYDDAQGGYTIVGVAKDGEEAIAKYRELKESGIRPDVVTMDIVMPKVDGVTVIKEIKDYDPDARILAISALGSPDTIDRVMQAGAQDYIIKPFSVDDLMDMINSISAPRGQSATKKAPTLVKENIIPGTIASSADGQVVVTVENAAIEAISDYAVDERVKVHIDPANIELQKRKQPDATKSYLQGTVAEITQSSPISQVKLDCGFELAVTMPSKALESMHLAIGDMVYASFGALAAQVKL